MTDEPMEGDPQEPGRLRDMYEQAARERAEAQAQLAQLQSRELFRDAGFDLTSKPHQAFLKGYDGELTAEAVKQYADELGVGAPQAPPPEQPSQPPPATETEALQRIAQASMEANLVTPPSPTEAEAKIRAQMEEAFRRGRPKAELDQLSEQLTRARGFRTIGDWEHR